MSTQQDSFIIRNVSSTISSVLIIFLIFSVIIQQQYIHASLLNDFESNCQMTIETYNKLTSSHDYKFLPNVYGSWKLIGSLTDIQKRMTPANTLVDCPTSIEVTMVTVTANILRQTLFGLSINIVNNNTYYDTKLWAMAYQPRMTPLYFEMFTDIDFNETISTTSSSSTYFDNNIVNDNNINNNNDNNNNKNDNNNNNINDINNGKSIKSEKQMRRISLIGQELIINSTRVIREEDGITIKEPQMTNPSTDYVYIKPVRIRKAFFGTEFIVQAKLENLLRSSLLLRNDRVKESIPLNLSDLLLKRDLETKFEFKFYASKNSRVQFPLPNDVIFGESNVLFNDRVSLDSPLEDLSLTMQRRVVSANYAISTLVVVVNGVTVLIILFLLIYFRNTEPRESRGYLPYLVMFQVIVNFCRILLQSFWGEEYLLTLFTFTSFGLLSFSYLLYFMNTLFFFYKRKVYGEMYHKLKRDSLDRKKQENATNLDTSPSSTPLNHSPSDSPPNENPTRKDSNASINSSEKSKQLTFRWARSKKVKIFTVSFMLIVQLIIYSIIIPLLFTVPATNVLISIQTIGAVLIGFAVVLVLIAFGIDIAANKKLLFEKCKWSSYFVRNDRLYYRLEMLVHIISLAFFISMGVARSISMTRTDDMITLLSNTYAPSVIVATFIALPLELIAIFLELMASGGGFICIMTLYERIRLSNQCAEGIGFLFDRYNDQNEGETSIELDEIIKFRIIRNSPYLDLLGDELARLFIDEKGFELIRQYSKTEFSIENLAFISDMEKVYTQLFMAVARPRSVTRKSPSSDRPQYRPQLKQNLTNEDIIRATNELKDHIYKMYVPDSAPMTVNLSSYSKGIFNKWVTKDCFIDDNYIKSETFVNDLDFVVLEVVKNLRDTFRRLQLTTEYKQWLEIVKKNSLSLHAIQKAKALTKDGHNETNNSITTPPPTASTAPPTHANNDDETTLKGTNVLLPSEPVVAAVEVTVVEVTSTTSSNENTTSTFTQQESQSPKPQENSGDNKSVL